EIGRLRGGTGRFRGLRLVHPHLRGASLSADDLNDLALLRLDLVGVLQAEEDGLAGAIEVATLDPAVIAAEAGEESGERELFVRTSARRVQELDLNFDLTIRALETELARRTRRGIGAAKGDRVLVLGVAPDETTFAEALELVRSTDAVVAGELRQRRRRLHPRTVVGKGKLTEIVLEAMRRDSEVVVFDVDLKPAQARGFEDATGLRTVDRTQLILDVFAQRARSRDGKLQVELAQLQYSLPRLTEKDAGLSRLTGGIGGRGPGETVLEISRRRIRDRVRKLSREIDRLSQQRDLRRSRRRRGRVPALSLIGYTNAGKSSLLNALTDSEVVAADKLFMTLDPTSRRLRFPREGEVVITDTVGFIADLPPDLVTAFRATLEELADADLLLHVADAADPELGRKLGAVNALLETLELAEIPRLLILNKADLVDPAGLAYLAQHHEGLAVSATRGDGLPVLIRTAEARLGGGRPFVRDYGTGPVEAAASLE
ncbi:MAG: GTPase HflX, partial [Acidobacteriota bacterium]|nr:GTPase HflX [Acidobacteriota bacterium]